MLRGNRRLAVAVAAATCALAGLLAFTTSLPLWDMAASAVTRLQTGGWTAVAAFSVAHIFAIVLFVPISPFVFAAGFVWGAPGGTLIITFGNLIGPAIAFALAKRWLRPTVQRHLGGHRHVEAIDRAMALGGFQAVVLLRLSPIVPMSILNYGLGLFEIGIGRYIAATAAGLLPITVLYCWGAAGLGELSDVAAGNVATGPLQTAMFWLGLLATFAAVWWLQRLAGRAMSDAGSIARSLE